MTGAQPRANDLEDGGGEGSLLRFLNAELFGYRAKQLRNLFAARKYRLSRDEPAKNNMDPSIADNGGGSGQNGPAGWDGPFFGNCRAGPDEEGFLPV